VDLVADPGQLHSPTQRQPPVLRACHALAQLQYPALVADPVGVVGGSEAGEGLGEVEPGVVQVRPRIRELLSSKAGDARLWPVPVVIQ
jgi:hypothetical protein